MQFNQKLHSSKLYNGFQFTVSALAVFSGSTYNSMKKHQETLTCFVAGTMILTASGLVAIENIKAGDKVISTYPETMETSPKTVLETYIREVTTLVHLTVNGEEIVTTVDHPFLVVLVCWCIMQVIYMQGDHLDAVQDKKQKVRHQETLTEK